MMQFPPSIDRSWSLFLDRDGVINKRIVDGYVQSPGEFVFLPGVLDALAFFSEVFGKIIVVTNQQGIGKGRMNEKQLEAVHRKMLAAVNAAGGRIDAVFYCPDLASKPQNCRKPSPFLAREAVKKFPQIDLKKSIMAGDAESDVDFGKNAGMMTVFLGKDGPVARKADFCFSGLPELALFIRRFVS